VRYIDCKKYAQEILDAVKAIPNKKRLVIISVGDNPASKSYVKGKIKDCEYCGIPYDHFRCSPNIDSDMLCWLIHSANENPNVSGIIVQLPLPKGMDEKFYTDQVLITKDVDGFKENSPFKPCTPEGIMYLLRKEVGDLTGKRALVIGRGKLVGEPIARMLLDADCTVTVAHSKTDDLNFELQHADIVVSAVGKPNTVNLDWCYRANIVVDVGVNRDANGKLVGDCYNFGELHSRYMKVTPVPGGIGLMTRAMLMAHVAGLDVSTI
jgi:methylenetetrahydrofolate dehydrogenase (NADP+)/methenyltetrahydrofolate cyclohydrolase